MQMKKSSEVSISHLTAKEVNKVDSAKAVDRGQCMPGGWQRCDGQQMHPRWCSSGH